MRGLLFFVSTSRRMLSTGSSVTALSFLSNLGAARSRASARPQQDGNPCRVTLASPPSAINSASTALVGLDSIFQNLVPNDFSRSLLSGLRCRGAYPPLRFEPDPRLLRLTLGRPSDRALSPGLIKSNIEGAVPVHITTSSRLLGFDLGDWSLLVMGFIVAGLLVLLA